MYKHREIRIEINMIDKCMDSEDGPEELWEPQHWKMKGKVMKHWKPNSNVVAARKERVGFNEIITGHHKNLQKGKPGDTSIVFNNIKVQVTLWRKISRKWWETSDHSVLRSSREGNGGSTHEIHNPVIHTQGGTKTRQSSGDAWQSCLANTVSVSGQQGKRTEGQSWKTHPSPQRTVRTKGMVQKGAPSTMPGA